MRLPLAHRVASKLNAPFSPHASLPFYRKSGDLPQSTVFADRGSPVFISARFRSGSTLLWQCFQRLEGFTAYYEPFNERRWFDPQKRGDQVDASHRGVADYASNYEDLQHLGTRFEDHWGTRQLSLGAGARHTAMQTYIEGLIEAATGRAVLQFNRVDFRLPYLRATFPNATFVHLSRNPRDTWCSTLRGVPNDPSWTITSFGPFCKFYLTNWYLDLSMSYPRLWRSPDNTHPYEIHYLIHRLSELFAYRDCHYFMQYEAIEKDLVLEMAGLLACIGEVSPDLSAIDGLLAPRKQAYDHSDHIELYSEIEARVESELLDWLGTTSS